MIRETTENDRSVWLALRKLVYTDCSDAFHEAEIDVWLRDEEKACFLCDLDGEAAGFVEVSLRNVVDGCLTSPVGYVEGIYVFPAYRGRGVAKQLLRAAEDWMRTKGCTEMGSDSELHNQDAIRFHKAIGFEETYRVVQFKKSLD